MDPKIWGPGLWKYLHSAAASASSQQKRKDFVEMIKALAKTLPCEKCKAHFLQNLQTFKITDYMTSNESLFMWTYNMHDAVNVSQGKTGSQRPSFEEVYKMYFDVASDSEAVDFKKDYHDPICQDVCSSQMSQDKMVKLGQPSKPVPSAASINQQITENKTDQMKTKNYSQNVKKYVTKRNV